MNAYSPMVEPQTTVALAPMDAPFFTRVLRYSSFRTTSLRGLKTLVKTMEGPQKTLSSSSTPSYTLTLFWILQLSPTFTLGPMTTFWPMLHFFPTLTFLRTWEKCQIFDPSPMVEGSSM